MYVYDDEKQTFKYVEDPSEAPQPADAHIPEAVMEDPRLQAAAEDAAEIPVQPEVPLQPEGGAAPVMEDPRLQAAAEEAEARPETPAAQSEAPRRSDSYPGPVPPEPEKKKKGGGSRALAIVLACVLAFVCGLGGGILGSRLFPAKTGPANMQGAGSEAASGEKSGGEAQTVIYQIDGTDTTVAEAIADKVMPSVVGITATIEQTYSSFWGFGSQTYDATAVGTGVVVESNGYILTNSHVINDGDYKSIVVSFYDGSELDGTVLWNDSTLDLAVVKVDATGLVAAELGDSDELKIGTYAAAIGNPLGLAFERSMSQGIISGLDRTIDVGSESSGSTTRMEGLIQTDATINSGNSGGPLLNSKGQVVGINSAKASGGEGMGFAIPINTAKEVVAQIKETGRFERAYLGIRGIGLGEQTQYSSAQLKEYFGTDTGVYVSSITEGGGAQEAGLQAEDIILSVDGVSVSSMNKINTQLIKHRVGDTVTVEVMRDGKTFTATITLKASGASAAPKLEGGPEDGNTRNEEGSGSGEGGRGPGRR